MPNKRHQQRGSGNPGTYYAGFGPFYAEYPHVLLGGGNPGFNYDGYGLTAAQYPGAERMLATSGFRSDSVSSPYPQVFSGGGKRGELHARRIVDTTHKYLKGGNPTWSGLAGTLKLPGLVSLAGGGPINVSDSEVYYQVGIASGGASPP